MRKHAALRENHRGSGSMSDGAAFLVSKQSVGCSMFLSSICSQKRRSFCAFLSHPLPHGLFAHIATFPFQHVTISRGNNYPIVNVVWLTVTICVENTWSLAGSLTNTPLEMQDCTFSCIWRVQSDMGTKLCRPSMLSVYHVYRKGFVGSRCRESTYSPLTGVIASPE